MSFSRESAVSPVIGILLMLVVTIIIAAVVSAFAGGLVKNETKTPQVSFSATSNVNSVQGVSNYPSDGYTYPSGYTEDKNYIEFTHKGGDTLTMADIRVQFQSGDTKITLGTDSKVNTDKTTAFSCRADPSSATYFNQVGKTDGIIATGDKLRIICDGNYDGWGSQYLFFRPDGMEGGFGLPVGSVVSYSIIDKVSGKTISSGSLRV